MCSVIEHVKYQICKTFQIVFQSRYTSFYSQQESVSESLVPHPVRRLESSDSLMLVVWMNVEEHVVVAFELSTKEIGTQIK